MKTTFPTTSLKIQEWLRYVSIPQLNLNLVDNSLLGRAIKEGYKTDPYNTIKMIQQLYKDNPLLMEETISNHNLQPILKCNP